MKLTTERNKKICGIHYICAEIMGSPVTCYVLRGKHGDMLIDTGIPFMYKALTDYLSDYDIKYIFFFFFHVDHDANEEKMRKSVGAVIFLR